MTAITELLISAALHDDPLQARRCEGARSTRRESQTPAAGAEVLIGSTELLL